MHQRKGYFNIKVPKLKIGIKYTVKSYYRGRLYSKKNFYAVTKGLIVNRIRTTDRKITGYTTPGCKVIAEINGKTYAATANTSSGYWKVYLDEPIGSNGFQVKIYKASDAGKNPETEQHKHTYTQPIYAKVHHEEIGHMETVTDPPTYHDEKCEHVICQDCGKDLTQAYIEGIKDGTYKNVKITSDVSYSQNKSSSILKMYNLSYDSSMPLYEDYLNNGGWDRSCKNKNVTTKIVTVSVCSPGATWNKWIVDKKAYDEQVIVGYKCSCGEWKLVTN